jgi:hypothetical protein
MPTAAEFVLVTDRKLMGKVDFDSYLLKYLRNDIRASVKRLFIQGSFVERMPLSSPGANQVEVELKPTLLDGFAHDGAGRLLDLEQIDRVATFENELAQTYEVGAGYIEYPIGIRINPRTGMPEYDRMIEGIGLQAVPNSVSTDGTTLTIRVDSLFEHGSALGIHIGRQVRVFMLTPAAGAMTEAVAIETATVTWTGTSNQIQTVGLLGQDVASIQQSFYLVQLIGLCVFRDSATNRPSQRPDEMFFIGTVEGTGGGTPSVFDITDQNLIQAQAAGSVTVTVLPDWADGTSNAGGDAQTVFEDLIHDLTATTGARGAGKLTAPALPDWADSTANPADILSDVLAKFITDLTSTTGGRGAAKLTAAARGNWLDATANPATLLSTAVAKIIDDLTATSGGRGAAKITSPALPPWADGTPMPAGSVAGQLAKIITDLTDVDGTQKIVVDTIAGYPIALPSGTLGDLLDLAMSAVNSGLLSAKRRAEAVGAQTLKRLWTNTSWTLNDIAFLNDGFNHVLALVAAGDHGAIVSRAGISGQWTSHSPAGGYTGDFKAIEAALTGFAAVGSGGEIQTSTDAVNWFSRHTGGSDFNDIAFKPDATATLCAVGQGGYIWTSTNLTSWTQQTGPAGMTTDNFVSITYGYGKGHSSGVGKFVAMTDGGKVMTSPDGVTWTAQPSGTITGSTPKYLPRMLQNNAKFGFVALYTRASGTEIGVAYSDDGVTWTIVASLSSSQYDEPNMRLALLDESILYLSTKSATPPYSLNVMQVYDPATQPVYVSSDVFTAVYDIGECWPFGALNVLGTLFVVGRLNNGDGCVMSGAPFRPIF